MLFRSVSKGFGRKVRPSPPTLSSAARARQDCAVALRLRLVALAAQALPIRLDVLSAIAQCDLVVELGGSTHSPCLVAHDALRVALEVLATDALQLRTTDALHA